MAYFVNSKPFSKVAQISASLRQMAEDVGPDGKLPTYATLLETLDVSRTTLDSALNALEGQRVLYRRHGVGIFAAPHQPKCLAILADIKNYAVTTHSPFWGLILERAHERAEAGHEQIHLHFVSPLQRGNLPVPESFAHEIEEERIQGVLGIGLDPKVAAWLDKKGIPAVHFAGPTSAQFRIRLNGSNTIQILAQELVKRGCQRLGYWRGHDATTDMEWTPLSVQEDIEAIRGVLADHDQKFLPELVRTSWQEWPESHRTMQEHGYQMAMRVFSEPRHQWPDGVVLSDDMLTYGVLKALTALKLHPGQDLLLATSSNSGSPVLSGHEGELVRAEYDLNEFIHTAFGMLELLMSGQQPEQNCILFKSKLIL